jgi:DNA-binding NarL/FixJ family response regulator
MTTKQIKNRLTVQIALVDGDVASSSLVTSALLLCGKHIGVASYNNGVRATSEFLHNPPDIVFVEIQTPGVSEPNWIDRIKNRHPDTIVIIHTHCAAPKDIFPAFEAGADGYLVKSDPLERWPITVRRAFQGDKPISRTVSTLIVKSFHTFKTPWVPLTLLLTSREREVMKFLANNTSDKEISQKMGIGTATIHTYTNRIFQKLRVHSRVEAVQRVAEWYR